VWSLLVDLGVERNRISTYYLFLIQKPGMLRALVGCPWENRKDLLMDMIVGNAL